MITSCNSQVALMLGEKRNGGREVAFVSVLIGMTAICLYSNPGLVPVQRGLSFSQKDTSVINRDM